MGQQTVNVTQKSVAELKELWQAKAPMNGIHTLATHENPHIEEICGHLIFYNYGTHIFPDCKKIQLGFINNEKIKEFLGGKMEDAFWKLLQKGFLFFGMAGGPLDDHVKENVRDCAATLLAKHLGVKNNPELTRLFEYLLYTDKNGDKVWTNDQLNKEETKVRDACQALLPAKLVKNLHFVAREKKWSEEIKISYIQSIMDIMSIEIESQKIFHESKKERPQVTIFPINKTAVAVFIVSKSSKAAQLARSIGKTLPEARNKRIALTISANPETGMFACLKDLNGNGEDDLTGLTAILRSKVANKRNLNIPKSDMSKVGTIEPIPLFLHPEQGNLFNGSFSQPTKDGLYGKVLAESELREAVWLGLGKNFHGNYKDNCFKGTCAGDKCPLFGLGLTQCQKAKKAS